jgi:protein gp37
MADRTSIPITQATWNPITGGDRDPRDVRAVLYPYLAAGVPLYFKQWGGRHNKALKNTLAGEKWAQLGGYISHNVCR